MLVPLCAMHSTWLSATLLGVAFSQFVEGIGRWSHAPFWHRRAKTQIVRENPSSPHHLADPFARQGGAQDDSTTSPAATRPGEHKHNPRLRKPRHSRHGSIDSQASHLSREVIQTPIVLESAGHGVGHGTSQDHHADGEPLLEHDSSAAHTTLGTPRGRIKRSMSCDASPNAGASMPGTRRGPLVPVPSHPTEKPQLMPVATHNGGETGSQPQRVPMARSRSGEESPSSGAKDTGGQTPRRRSCSVERAFSREGSPFRPPNPSPLQREVVCFKL